MRAPVRSTRTFVTKAEAAPKHTTPFKVFFDIDIGGDKAGRIVMEVRYRYRYRYRRSAQPALCSRKRTEFVGVSIGSCVGTWCPRRRRTFAP
eukprot:3110467-Pyramimonas_sp.AAC.1